MYPNGPGPGPGGMPGGNMPEFAQYAQHDGWWSGPMHLLPLLLFAILIGVVVWAVLRMTSQHGPAAAGAGAAVGLPPTLPPRDHAQEELRVRYARGEIDRTEYRQRAVDLGIVHADAPLPLSEAPPDQQE